MEWKPIETAPRDGTTVLLRTHSGDICSAWFAPGEWSNDTPISPAEYSGDCWVCCDDRFQIEAIDMGEHGFDDGEAGHWMPLPKPPQDDAAECGEAVTK